VTLRYGIFKTSRVPLAGADYTIGYAALAKMAGQSWQ